MPNQSPKILIIGAGAVGSTIANWIAPHHDELYVLDQGETLDTIKKNGVSAYLQNNEDKKENVTVKTISDLKDIETPDYIFLCVKNYSLATLAKLITESYGNNPVIVAFQNGAENQEILPVGRISCCLAVVVVKKFIEMINLFIFYLRSHLKMSFTYF